MRFFCKAIPSFFIFHLFSSVLWAQSTARYANTSTLLPDGSVLIVGGQDSTGALIATPNDVEIYVSTGATLIAGPTMGAGVERSSHTATLLPNGTVLIAGGADGSGAPRIDGRIYDPVTNSWGGSINMVTPRYHHTATLLPNGTVLITGGQTDSAGTVTNSCEIFTPGSPGSFAACNSMLTARVAHTATLLYNGNVFVAGGVLSGGAMTNTTEIYNTASGQWTPGAALITGRAFHTATGMGNRMVMISGGYNRDVDTFGQELDVDGRRGFLEMVELYNPISNTMAAPPQPTQARKAFHTATLDPSGELKIFGGLGNIKHSNFTNTMPFETGSSLVSVVSIAPSTGVIQASPASSLQIKLNATLSVPVSGDIIKGQVYFVNARASLQDADITFATNTLAPPPEYPTDGTYAKLDGTYVGCDPAGNCGKIVDRIVTILPPGGTIYFKPQTVTGEDSATSAGTLNISGGGPCPANGTCGIDSSSNFTATIDIPMPVSDIGGTMLTGDATILGGSIAQTDGFTVTLTGGSSSAGFSGGVVTADGAGANYIRAGVTFSNLSGTVQSGAGGAVPNGQSLSSLALTGLQLYVRYVISPVDLSGATFNFSIATITIRSMIFGDLERYNPSTNQWTFNFPRNTPKFAHSTILTPDSDNNYFGGRRCDSSGVCSGFSALTGPSGYFPIPGAFAADGALNGSRGSHTSTVLSDGRVLVAGGTNGSAMLNSAEIYDPSTKRWTSTGSLRVARAGHTATLLPNGRVMVAGGYVSNASTATTNSAEVYYPESGQWALTSVMISSRQAHTATLLPNGTVLIAGGYANGSYLNAAEIYISTSGMWYAAANMPNSLSASSGRADHTAILLRDGRVLMIGGINSSGGPLRDVEGYDWTTGSWNAFNPADMPTGIGRGSNGRFAHTATLLMDGRVFIAGGDDGLGEILDPLMYDPRTDVWSDYTSAPDIDIDHQARLRHTAVLLPNGRLFLIGGVTAGGSSINSMEVFKVGDAWETILNAMPTRRGHHTSALLSNGYVLNIGGANAPNTYTANCDSQYFGPFPDAVTPGAPPSLRQPTVSGMDRTLFDRGNSVTILGSHFTGATEASGSGQGPQDSSHHQPRVYFQTLDGSGWLMDLTPNIYANTANIWTTVDSSVTITVPATPALLPYGWYHVRMAANAQFANSLRVHAGPSLPTGISGAPTGVFMSPSSILWTWTPAPAGGGTIDGYSVYSASNSVFISTVSPLGCTTTCQFLQTGIGPGTATSVKVAVYNLSGDGPLVLSTQTLTTPPVTIGPPGSLSVVIDDPAAQYVLSGTLGSGRNLYLRFPPHTFEGPTTLTVSPRTAIAACANPAGLDAAVTIVTSPSRQPQLAVDFGLSFSRTETGVLPFNTLTMIRYDSVSGGCVPMTSRADLTQDMLMTQINHFTDFQMQQLDPQAAIGGMRVFPNPINLNSQGFMTFDRLTAGTRVRIYTLRGEEIFDGTANSSGMISWAVANKSGRPVGSGIYVAVIDSGGRRETLKLVVLR